MDVLIDGVAAIGFAWLVLIVHESGHLLVARLAGIGSSDAQIVMNSGPAHVALRSGEQWLAPDDPGYADTFRELRPGLSWAAMFIAGGFLVEVPLSLIAIIALATIDHGAGPVLAWTTAVVSSAYLIGDVALSAKSGRPYGDHMALWGLHRPVAAPWWLRS